LINLPISKAYALVIVGVHSGYELMERAVTFFFTYRYLTKVNCESLGGRLLDTQNNQSMLELAGRFIQDLGSHNGYWVGAHNVKVKDGKYWAFSDGKSVLVIRCVMGNNEAWKAGNTWGLGYACIFDLLMWIYGSAIVDFKIKETLSFFLTRPSSVQSWTLAFLLNFHRLCGTIEGRSTHFLLRDKETEIGQWK